MTSTRDLIGNLNDLMELSKTLVKSGLLPTGVKSPEAAAAIILKGREIGMPVMEAFSLINIIAGKPTVAPQGMLALIYRSRQLADMTIADDGKVCAVTMTRLGGKPHTEKFGMVDAARMMTQETVNGEKKTIPLADKYNWRQMPEVMRKWRAISACARVVFPDVIAGMYLPEELGADVDEEGEIVDGQVQPATDEAPPPSPDTSVAVTSTPEQPTNGKTASNGHAARPFPPELLREKIETTAKKHADGAAGGKQRGLLAGTLELCFPGEADADRKRHSVTKYLTGYDSLKGEGMPDPYVLALLDWIKPAKDSGGAWFPDAMAQKEAGLILRQALVEAGQAELPITA